MATMINKITVRVGKTVNLGNYESLRADVELTESLPEGEYYNDKGLTEARKELSVRAARELDITIQNMVKAFTS